MPKEAKTRTKTKVRVGKPKVRVGKPKQRVGGTHIRGTGTNVGGDEGRDRIKRAFSAKQSVVFPKKSGESLEQAYHRRSKKMSKFLKSETGKSFIRRGADIGSRPGQSKKSSSGGFRVDLAARNGRDKMSVGESLLMDFRAEKYYKKNKKNKKKK